MKCVASANTVNNFRVVDRYGYWNGTTGFGWQKALLYHNLWIKPQIDVIYSGSPSGPDTNRNYTVAYYPDGPGGPVAEIVVVSADIQETSFKGTATPDHRSVGVLTGYCETPQGAEQPRCPDGVNRSL